MKRKLLILFLFLLCCGASFLVKTMHFNREAARVAQIIGDTEPLWEGTYNASDMPNAAAAEDFLPMPRPNFMPFTIESAMMYAYAQDIAAGKGVPARDWRLAYLPDVPPYAQMNMLLEWILGWSYRALNLVRSVPEPEEDELKVQDMPDFARFTAVSIRIWTSLIPGLIFLWLAMQRTPLSLSCAAGLLHAFSAAALARATGQDIVRGDLCITLFLICLVLGNWCILKPARWKYLLLGLMTAASFAAWDLCQLLFGAWGCVELLRWLAGGRFSERRKKMWLVITLAIVFTALLVPFHRVYGLIMTELVCVLLPLLCLAMYGERLSRAGWLRKLPPAAGRVILLGAGTAVLMGFYTLCIDNQEFRSGYSHFSEAMKAKIRFGNVKPRDPALLSYDARIMWTPAMHSANWYIARNFFPSPGSLDGMDMHRGPGIVNKLWNFCPLTLAFAGILLLLSGLWTPVRTAVRRDMPRLLLPLVFTIGFTAGFVYIVRYHEFVIIFLAMTLGLLLHEYQRAFRSLSGTPFRRLWSGTLALITVFLLLFELTATLTSRFREYGHDLNLRYITRLIRWMRETDMLRNKVVVTDFMAGPMLMAYCGSGVVLQPQFGLAAIRNPVEEYIRIMFHGTEEELAKFCRKYGAEYVVYDMEMTLSMNPYSLRYIACSPEMEMRCPANLMLHFPRRLRFFREVRVPRRYEEAGMKYRIFRLVSGGK